jgi:hypothetical protein
MVERRPGGGRDGHRGLVRRARTARHPGPTRAGRAGTGPTGRRTCADADRTARADADRTASTDTRRT